MQSLSNMLVQAESTDSVGSRAALGTLFGADVYVQPELAEQTWARLREGGERPVMRGEWVAPPKCLRVAVLGATGGVGQQVARLALAAGHVVVALVREPSEMVPRRARRLHTFGFDAHSCSASELAPLLKGCETSCYLPCSLRAPSCSLVLSPMHSCIARCVPRLPS